MPLLSWSKVLSLTDAQRPTRGRIVPYLRLTKSGHKIDSKIWFRHTFFDFAKWKPGTFGNETGLEEAFIDVDFNLNGVPFGTLKCHLTHGPNRWESHSTPNTWLHWPDVIQAYLRKHDLSGHTVNLDRTSSNKITLTI